MSTAPRVFISYSHKDEVWKDRLVTQLKVLEYEGHFALWDDQRIGAGDEWRAEIAAALDEANVAVLLISADYLVSEFARGVEVPRLLQRRRSEGLRVIPLIVRACEWQRVAWLEPIQPRPSRGKPLASLPQHEAEEALSALAGEISSLLNTPAGRPAVGGAGGASRRGMAGTQPAPSRVVVDVRITLLFLAANPEDQPVLALDEEARLIQTKIRASDFRDAIHIDTRWAARPDDLLQALNEVRPAVVHFSGHGRHGEILLKDDDGTSTPVSRAALVELLRAFRKHVRLVVFNACYGRDLAEAAVSVVECAVGMPPAADDEAARVFAASFYRAIGFGHSVADAFQQGRVALAMGNLAHLGEPQLVARAGVDPDRVFLVPAADPPRP